MAAREYHRGDVFTAQINPCWSFPEGDTIPIMIIQNDVGEMPCQTVTAIRLKPSRKRSKRGWVLYDNAIHRYDKRQLNSYIGRLAENKSEALIAQAETRYGFHVPSVLEAP